MAVKMKKANNTNTYIHQLQAHKFLQALSKKDSLTFEDLKLNFTGSLPDSQTLRYIQKQYPEKFFVYKRTSTSKGKKTITAFTRTTAIIDVAFSDDFREVLDKPITLYSNNKRTEIAKSYGDVILTASEIYNKFYTDGFYLNDIHYVLLQRSTSKSRLGQTLFVDEAMLDNILAWSRMELDFIKDEPCDVTSLMAYESLTLSGIIGTVNIEPHEILLIDDVKSCFTARASLTQYDEKKKCLVATEKDIQQESDIYDGQSLLDTSKFTGEYQGKGMALLRNKLFKSCAFNTNVQLWFLDNGITDVSQLKGLTLAKNISDIKLITTPNSLKAIKFAYKLGCTKEQEKETMFRYWLEHIDYDFGVVKYEKPSTFGKRNQLSYQMINSLPLSYDDVLSLAQHNIKQIDRINNDFAYFKEYIRPRNDDEEPNITKDMLYNLCCYNPQIQHTELYKSQRRETVKTLKNHMLNGRLLVSGDYATLVSCPIEMLKSACGIQWESSLHKPYEIHTTMFDDGVELVGFRNPHVASGNVCVFTNRKLHEVETYLNLTRNIVVINAYKNDVLARCQGADMDSDTCLLTNDSIVLAAAKECTKFATPINGIKGDKQQRYYNKSDIAEVDYIIGQNMIGQIINLSQIFNSYYWDYQMKGATPAQLQTIYDCVSILSSMSQLEIDKAKKFFSLNVSSELKKIIGTTFNNDKLQILKNERTCLLGKKHRLELKVAQDDSVKPEYDNVCICLEKNKQDIKEFKKKNKIIQIEPVQLQKMLLSDADNEALSEYEADLKSGDLTEEDYNELVQNKLSYSKDKQVRPSFFRHNSKDKKCKFVPFHTPMDFLIQIVDSEVKKAGRDTTPMELTQLLLDTSTEIADRKQINKILTIAEGIRDELQFHYLRHKEMAKSKNGKFNYQAYKDEKQILISDGLDSLSTVKISKVETMLLLLKRCYSSSARVKNEATHQYRTTLVGMLYKTHTDLFMECFK